MSAVGRVNHEFCRFARGWTSFGTVLASQIQRRSNCQAVLTKQITKFGQVCFEGGPSATVLEGARKVVHLNGFGQGLRARFRSWRRGEDGPKGISRHLRCTTFRDPSSTRPVAGYRDAFGRRPSCSDGATAIAFLGEGASSAAGDWVKTESRTSMGSWGNLFT